MAKEDLDAIGLSPEKLFSYVVSKRPINFTPEERSGLAANLAQTDFVKEWMAQKGLLESFARDSLFTTYLSLQTGNGNQGLLADIASRAVNLTGAAEAFEIYQSAATSGVNDV